jgi:(5-formylfuran-3-yl)methyl phosphate synthase
LVSVRSGAEALVALEGGADVVDVKEPRNGALGAAEVRVWREVLGVLQGRVVVSVALGELLDDESEARAGETRGFSFAKIGFAGCEGIGDWGVRWERVIEKLPVGVEAVPVAYADWGNAGSPQPMEVLSLAEESVARMMLIDTFDKCAGSLLDVLPMEKLRGIARQATKRGVRLALAGSLVSESIERVLELAPAYVGVRGAACVGGRDGTIDLGRVKSLAEVVRGARRMAAS